VSTLKGGASAYTLGVGPNGIPLEVIYRSGTVTGYESCFYFMPETKSFVIVLTNTTGLVDTSDHISRLLLQELFELNYKPSKLRLLIGKFKFSKAIKFRFSKSIGVDFIEKACLGAQERHQYIDKFLSPDLSETLLLDNIVGRYTNTKYHQYVVVSYNVDNVLQAQVCGATACSSQFKLTSVDRETLRLCLFPRDKLCFRSVDVFADWKSLDFVIGRDNSGNVVSLTRAREGFPVTYVRSL
jgi:hypothetical protein